MDYYITSLEKCKPESKIFGDCFSSRHTQKYRSCLFCNPSEILDLMFHDVISGDLIRMADRVAEVLKSKYDSIGINLGVNSEIDGQLLSRADAIR